MFLTQDGITKLALDLKTGLIGSDLAHSMLVSPISTCCMVCAVFIVRVMQSSFSVHYNYALLAAIIRLLVLGRISVDYSIDLNYPVISVPMHKSV